MSWHTNLSWIQAEVCLQMVRNCSTNQRLWKGGNLVEHNLKWIRTGRPIMGWSTKFEINLISVVEYGRITERHVHLLGTTVPQLEFKHQQTKCLPLTTHFGVASNNCHCDVIMSRLWLWWSWKPHNLRFRKAQCISSSAAWCGRPKIGP